MKVILLRRSYFLKERFFMLGGIVAGLVSAFLQSSAYVFSRRFIVRHQSPFKLMIYGTLHLAIFSVVMLMVLTPFVNFTFTPVAGAWMVVFAVCGCLGNFSFFRALRDIEASRLSSLMGLKLAVLTPLNLFFVSDLPGIWQIISILLSMLAAVGMNFTGGPLKLRGLIFLGITLVCYSMTDIAAAEMTRMVNCGHLSAFYATSLAFTAMGAAPAIMLWKMKFEKECFKDAFPYGAFWFAAMILLFMTFGLIGVLYGTIIQATRGVFSVILGWALLKAGIDRLEPEVSTAAWIRRLVMALLMIGAIALYNAEKF